MNKKKALITIAVIVVFIIILLLWWWLDCRWQTRQLEKISNDIIGALATNDIEQFRSYCDMETKYNNTENTWNFYNEYMPAWEEVNVKPLGYDINNFVDYSEGAYFYDIYCENEEGIKYHAGGLLFIKRQGYHFTIESIGFTISPYKEK